MIHLNQCIQKKREPDFSEVKTYIKELYSKWPKEGIVFLEADPDFEDINKYWPSSRIKDLGYYTHANLLWDYRNFLVHEFREPGYGMEFPDDKYTFYHTMQDIDTKENTWELVYPVGFFKNICGNTINNLKHYYFKNGINP
ncbi:hypothetical protein ACFL55_01200, partial [Candidatus Latescibacterota bacterium]